MIHGGGREGEEERRRGGRKEGRGGEGRDALGKNDNKNAQRFTVTIGLTLKKVSTQLKSVLP